MTDDDADDAERNFALALLPLAKEVADDVRARLPAGTHFGVFVLAPAVEPGGEGRVIAITSDRDVVLPAVAQWALTQLRIMSGR